jgi:cell division protein FtsA
VLQSLASAEAVLTPDEMEMGVALIDIGGGTTDIAIFKQGVLWYTAELSVAGSHITADLSRHLHVLPTEAEQLKLQYGGCRSDRNDKITLGARTFLREDVVTIVTARIDEIINGAAKHAKRSNHDGRLVAGLVVTGGSGLLPDLDQYLEQLTNVPVRIGIPTGYSGLGDMINHPACSTAVGLVLHGSRCSNPGIAECRIKAEGCFKLAEGDVLKSWRVMLLCHIQLTPS